MSIVLCDMNARKSLLPLTYTKAIADLRIGILTIRERWKLVSSDDVYVFTENYLQCLYDNIPGGEHLWVDASVLPDEHLTKKILSLEEGTTLADENGFIAGRMQIALDDFSPSDISKFFEKTDKVESVLRLQYPWQIFQWNDLMLRRDFFLITKNKSSQQLNETNKCITPENIFIEEGVNINFAVINASTGPVYIGKNAIVMENVSMRGPLALCEGAVVKMGAKIYGATTAGPYAVAGGEVKNVVLNAFSNKAHDGYLGDSVIGEWCNLGAGTSNSNVKNNGAEVKMWNYYLNAFQEVDIKCGMVMGDYSRTAINSSINTGAVIGICCNYFGEGLSPRFIPDFSWYGKSITRYDFDKATRDIINWKKMKGIELTSTEQQVLKSIFETLP